MGAKDGRNSNDPKPNKNMGKNPSLGGCGSAIAKAIKREGDCEAG